MICENGVKPGKKKKKNMRVVAAIVGFELGILILSRDAYWKYDCEHNRP